MNWSETFARTKPVLKAVNPRTGQNCQPDAEGETRVGRIPDTVGLSVCSWNKADHLGRILAACLNYSENMRFLVSQPSIHAGFRAVRRRNDKAY